MREDQDRHQRRLSALVLLLPTALVPAAVRLAREARERRDRERLACVRAEVERARAALVHEAAEARRRLAGGDPEDGRAL